MPIYTNRYINVTILYTGVDIMSKEADETRNEKYEKK